MKWYIAILTVSFLAMAGTFVFFSPVVIPDDHRATTDTVYVHKVTETKVIEKHIPYEVEVQKEPDIELRKHAENDNIVIGVEISKNKVQAATIDSSGKIVQESHELHPGDQVKIDRTGAVEITEDKKARRREKAKKIMNKAAGVAVAVAIFLLIKK